MDEEMESESRPYDMYLTVRGLLTTHYGLEHGGEIYDLLLRTALVASEDDMSPGIIFNDDGGQFVGLDVVE